MALDAVLEGMSGVMSALVGGSYDLVPIPDPTKGPRKVDVAGMYHTELYRPLYARKRGSPIFLSRATPVAA
jgi:6-phosphofructokinase 1